MPGRKSTGAPSLKTTKPSKPKAKRSQNALAIAEQQTPVRSRIRQGRLGQSEPELPKRRRQDEDEDAEIEEDQRIPKRRKGGEKDRYGNDVEYGSDSSGNEWTVGQVGDDDSDIDSDEAMVDSDNDGVAIRGSLANSSRAKHNATPMEPRLADQQSQDFDLRESGGDEAGTDEDSESLGADAVDLAAILDESDEVEGLSHTLGISNRDKEEDSGSAGDEEPESVAETANSTLSYSEDETDAANGAKLASLQTLVSTMNELDQKSLRAIAPIEAEESTAPSEFGLNSKRKLTVADLVPSIADPKLRKSLKLIADEDSKSGSKPGRIPKKLEVPLPKRQQDRLDRAAAYEKSKETLNRWIDTVKQNRRAEHLSFPLKDTNAAALQGSTRLLPTTQTQPLTDLESTIQNILQDSGLAVPNGKSGEDQLQAFEELKTNKMPLEEVQARRAELRRARELLFREEIRSKRIKKIKSKTYRKVHRKERERQSQQEKDGLIAAGVNDSESEQERKDRRRAEERMGARHRESKWAKGVKDSGRARWDEDARGGVTEMARRDEELRRRMEGKAVGENEDGIASSESEEYDDDEDDYEDGNARSDAMSSKRLQRLDEHDNELEAGTKGSRLASMDFMRHAEATRKARNNAELEGLRRDLAGEETPSEEEHEEGPGRKMFGPAKSNMTLPNPLQAAQKSEFEERPDSENGGEDGHEKTELEIVVDTAGLRGLPGSENRNRVHDRQRKQPSKCEAVTGTAVNPFLAPVERGSKDSKVGKKRAQDLNGTTIITQDGFASATSELMPQPVVKAVSKPQKASNGVQEPTTVLATATSDDENDDDTADRLPFVLRNHDLVARAFAGDKLVEDFEAEKRATMEDEDEKVVDNTLPGWGSWTGAGVSKKAQKRNRNKVLTKQPGIAKEKRKDARLDRVIINEKRVKKNGKYLASSLPHPFETTQQYQRSLRMPMGPEFQTKLGFQDATKPRVLMKQGIIAPMAKPTI